MKQFEKDEKRHEEKIKRMNEKINELEKERNSIDLSNLRKINSIMSLGDGQSLSVKNIEKDMYNIHVNKGCLTVEEGGKKLGFKECSNSKDQQFNLHRINNDEEYNKVLSKTSSSKVDSNSGIVYPFDLIHPINKVNKCINMKGNNLNIDECSDSKYYKWESSKGDKKCTSKFEM